MSQNLLDWFRVMSPSAHKATLLTFTFRPPFVSVIPPDVNHIILGDNGYLQPRTVIPSVSALARQFCHNAFLSSTAAELEQPLVVPRIQALLWLRYFLYQPANRRSCAVRVRLDQFGILRAVAKCVEDTNLSVRFIAVDTLRIIAPLKHPSMCDWVEPLLCCLDGDNVSLADQAADLLFELCYHVTHAISKHVPRLLGVLDDVHHHQDRDAIGTRVISTVVDIIQLLVVANHRELVHLVIPELIRIVSKAHDPLVIGLLMELLRELLVSEYRRLPTLLSIPSALPAVVAWLHEDDQRLHVAERILHQVFVINNNKNLGALVQANALHGLQKLLATSSPARTRALETIVRVLQTVPNAEAGGMRLRSCIETPGLLPTLAHLAAERPSKDSALALSAFELALALATASQKVKLRALVSDTHLNSRFAVAKPPAGRKRKRQDD